MKERGRFLYQDPDGVIFIKFEHPGKGVPIERLLPESGRGDGFKDFKITDYLDLADLVLADPKDWAEFCSTVDVSGATKDQPKKVSPPPPNLDFLKLRSGEGMDAERAAALFEIVAAYWHSKNDLGLEPGLVATLWHSGMKPDDILKHIGRFTNADGKLVVGGAKDERGFQILNAVLQTYKSVKGMAADVILQQSEMASVLETWVVATRAAKLQSAEMSNAVLHWSDYRRLSLVDAAGTPVLDNIRKLTEFVFSSDGALDFITTSAWAQTSLVCQSPQKVASSNVAKGLLKKKRKQGKLNRKRGRR